jgi:organic hydroperoxide reductase OsmC/OhrA
MATYTAKIEWKLGDGEDFPKGRYSRGHTLSFDGGAVVPASASPHVVGKWTVEAVDPDEMLVAALSEDCAGQASHHEGCSSSPDRMDRRRSGKGEAGSPAS